MLKTLIIGIALLIAVANVSAQTNGSKRYVSRKATVVRVGPATTYLKTGLSSEQVVRLLGEPSSISEHKQDNVSVVTYEFLRGEGRVLIAEFVGDALVSSRTETRAQIAKATR